MEAVAPTVQQRILLHLHGQRRQSGEFTVPVAVTQEGIARAVWIDVHHVVQYMRPLKARGWVEERTGHVQSGRRRRKVYALTDAGVRAAGGLREELLTQEVRVRDEREVRNRPIREVLEAHGAHLSLIDVLRLHVTAGEVDVRNLGARAGRARVRMQADAPRPSDFIGRKRELDALTAPDALPRMFVVRGVAGIGKSWLAARVCELLAESHDVFWHKVRPWDTPQSILTGLSRFLSALGKPALRASLAEGGLDAAARTLRVDLADVRAVLVLDDVQDAGPAVVPFLRLLRDVLADAPEVKSVLLTRTRLRFYDRRDVLSGLLREIDLEGFDPEEVEGLEGPAAHAATIRHPLFYRLLRHAAPGAAAGEVARDIRRFIEETIYADLSNPEQRMMKLASLYVVPVVADAFLSGALSPSVHRDLVDKALITQTGADRYVVHDTVREFFASTMTADERERAAGIAFERLRGFADRAAAERDLVSQLNYLSNALALAPTAADRAAVSEGIGDVQSGLGDPTSAFHAFRAALDAGPDDPSRARLHRKAASALLTQGNPVAAERELEAGFESLGRRMDAERAWFDLGVARLAARRENYIEAGEHANSALRTFEAAGDVEGQAKTLLFLAHLDTVDPTGSVAQAKAFCEAALARAGEALGAPFRFGVHTQLAFLDLYRTGDAESMKQHLASAAENAPREERSKARMDLLTLNGLRELLLLADFVGAERSFQQARALAGSLEIGATLYADYGMALADFYRGRFDEAREALPRVAEGLREHGDVIQSLQALCLAAECALLLDDPGGFHRAVEQSRGPDYAQARESRRILVATLEGLDTFLRGDLQPGLSALRAAAADGARTSDEYEPYAHFVYGVALESRGQTAEATRELRVASERFTALSRRAELHSLPVRRPLLVDHIRKSASG